MYVMSLLFLLASVASLLLGLRRGGLTLVFISIGCSVLAALFLGASVLRKRSDSQIEEEDVGSRVEEWRGTTPRGSRSAEVGEVGYPPERRLDPLAAEPLVGVVDRPVAGRHGPKPELPTASSEGDWESRVLGPDVVVARDRHTYHLPGCQHARGHHSGDRIKRAIAKRLGNVPCGVCRPG